MTDRMWGVRSSSGDVYARFATRGQAVAAGLPGAVVWAFLPVWVDDDGEVAA